MVPDLRKNCKSFGTFTFKPFDSVEVESDRVSAHSSKWLRQLLAVPNIFEKERQLSEVLQEDVELVSTLSRFVYYGRTIPLYSERVKKDPHVVMSVLDSSNRVNYVLTFCSHVFLRVFFDVQYRIEKKSIAD